MAEQLEALLQRIRTEGLEAAEKEAAALIDRARGEAARITGEAQVRAGAELEAARREAEKMKTAAEDAVNRALRDAVAAAGKHLEALFAVWLAESFDAAMKPSDWAGLALELVKTAGPSARVSVPDAVKPALEAALKARLNDELRSGLVLGAHTGGGVRVTTADGRLRMEASPESMAALLAEHLRPALAARLLDALKAGETP